MNYEIENTSNKMSDFKIYYVWNFIIWYFIVGVISKVVAPVKTESGSVLFDILIKILLFPELVCIILSCCKSLKKTIYAALIIQLLRFILTFFQWKEILILSENEEISLKVLIMDTMLVFI